MASVLLGIFSLGARLAPFLRKIDEIGGSVAFIINAEGIYRSRAWWTNVEKGGEEGNKTARAKRTEVNNGGGGVVGAMRRPQSTVVPRGYIL